MSATSDQGRGYLTMTSLAHQHYRARFDQLVADLQRTGLTTTGPVHERQAPGLPIGRSAGSRLSGSG